MAFDGKEFRGPNGVNVGYVLALADVVEASETFDMSTVVHTCGTPACIAGHMLTKEECAENLVHGGEAVHAGGGVFGLAGRLGIDYSSARALFEPPGWMFNAQQYTPAHGAAVLRKLAETGKVDWAGTKPLVSA